MKVSVAIPTWNGIEALRQHLPSVLAGAGEVGAEVVVCDDGSTDGTPEALAREMPEVRVVVRARNGGFAPAATDAVGACGGDAVLLLNNDMELHRGALPALVGALGADAELFAVVPSIVRVGTGVEESGTRLLFRRGVVATDLGAPPGAAPAYACGGAMLVRAAAFRALGGFDPLFAPFYWEDVDLSYRARKRGLRLARVLDARVAHDHGRTIGSRFARADVARIYERNRLLFTWKNVTDGGPWRRHLAALPLKLAWDLVAHPDFAHGLRAALRLRREVAGRRRTERLEALVPDRQLLEA